MPFHIRKPPRPTLTASEKLMMLTVSAVMRLFVSHMRLRASMERIDHVALERAADELRQIAWEAERKHTGETT